MGKMSKRSYDQHCTVAKALDVVGERWTLLLVRELSTGPKRFKDLLGGLPGVGTNLLAARLKALEGDGVVRRATLPPPAGSSVYELTELGRSLEPVIVALSRWGSLLMGEARDADDLRPGWAVVALRSALESGIVDGGMETYEFCVDGEHFHARVGGGGVEAHQGPATAPVLVIGGKTEDLLAIAMGRLELAEAVESGRVWAEGDEDALARCLKTLGARAT